MEIHLSTDYWLKHRHVLIPMIEKGGVRTAVSFTNHKAVNYLNLQPLGGRINIIDNPQLLTYIKLTQ